MTTSVIKKSHNVSQLLYHLVCPAKYRRLVFKEIQGVDQEIKQICLAIEQRYDIHFVEIGTDENHVHFLIQTVPVISPTNELPRRKQRGIPVLTMLVFKTKLVDLGEFVDIPFLFLGFLHTA